jgi:hypothetical protein
MCTSLYAENVLPPKELELLLVAFDAAYVHIYGPGTRRHIKNAFNAGATVEEIMEVLRGTKGGQACGRDDHSTRGHEIERNPTLRSSV